MSLNYEQMHPKWFLPPYMRFLFGARDDGHVPDALAKGYGAKSETGDQPLSF